jgi:YidC/Oxa1 family membrane protein insertase
MMSLFHDYLFTPIYNLLVFLVGIMPGGDVGLAVVLATLIVKIVLMPLSFAALKTQKAMKIMEPELKKVREKYKNDKETQARELFALYKKYDVKPLASFLTMFIQIPILIALYFVFINEALPNVDTSLLYSFVQIPAVISTFFLGIFAITKSSLVLAVFAGITQFAQASVMIVVPPKKEASGGTMQEEFGRAMALQARYVLPFIMGLVAYTSGAVALYFITSNLVGVAQELISRQMKFTFPTPEEVDA